MLGTAEILRRLEPAGLPDRELIARFVGQRDQSAFAELVRRHGAVVLGVCRRVTGHPQDAEDAFQAVFLVLARKAGRIGNPDLLGNWLYGVAVRVAQKARRSAARRRAREVAVSPLPDPPARPAPISGELGPILDEELAALPSWYRDAILLCDLRGVSREEAATLLGVPEGTLSSRLANGRKKLAARLTKRGVALSAAAIPAAVAELQAAIAVPNELITKTCGLVVDWSAGVPVPGPLAKLAVGGFTVRKTLLLGVMATAVAVTSVVYAARPDDGQTKTELLKGVAVAKGEEVIQPKADDKPGEKVAFTTRPRLTRAFDTGVRSIQNIVWSPDGTRLAISGVEPAPGVDARPEPQATQPAIHVFGFGDETASSRLRYPGKRDQLIGFTPGGKGVVTSVREYELVSGRHQLHFWEPEPYRKGAITFQKVEQRVDLDSSDTHGYAFAADSKIFRTVAYQRDAAGARSKMEVQEVDAATGRTLKTLLKMDSEEYVLSQDGKRLATVDKAGKVTVYDVDRGEKQSSHTLKETIDPARKSGGKGGGFPPMEAVSTYLTFSPDGRRLVVSRGIGQTVVLNTDTGEALPALEGVDMIRTVPGRSAFTSDGRLLALVGTRYTKTTTVGLGGREQTAYNSAGSFLTVWDTQTGKLLKSWDRTATVAFNPVRPLLAVLEKNDEETRLGLWDFAAEVEKK